MIRARWRRHKVDGAVWVVLSVHPDGLLVDELAPKTGYQRPRVVAALLRLEALGRVERTALSESVDVWRVVDPSRWSR